MITLCAGFRVLQSTHILTLPSFFGTDTMFATEWGYSYIVKKPTLNYFLTSYLILSVLSGLVLLRFCLTCIHLCLSGKWCSTMLVSKLYISWYDHENTFTYSCSNLANSICTCFSRDSPKFISFLPSSVPKLMTSIGSWCGSISFCSCSRRLANLANSSPFSSLVSSVCLIGSPKLHGIITVLLSVD